VQIRPVEGLAEYRTPLDTERTDDIVLDLVLRSGCESHDGHAGVISSKFAESQICRDD
jgi:hypothetical protein